MKNQPSTQGSVPLDFKERSTRVGSPLTILAELLSVTPQRISGTSGVESTRDWLSQKLTILGFAPRTESFQYSRPTNIQSATMALNSITTVAVTAFSSAINPLLGLTLVLAANILDFGIAPLLRFRSHRSLPDANILSGINRDWDELGGEQRQVVIVTAHYDSAEGVPEWFRILSERMNLWLVLGLVGMTCLLVYWVVYWLQSISWLPASYWLYYQQLWDATGRWLAVALLLPAAVTALVSPLASRLTHTEANPGADDNGSGVAVTLALCEELRNTPFSNIDIGVAFLSAEEAGLFGSRHFAARYGPKFDPTRTTILCLDGVGRGDTIGTVVGQGLFRRWTVDAACLHEWRNAVSSVTPKSVELWYTMFTGVTDQLAWLERGYRRTLSISHGKLVSHPFDAFLFRVFGIPHLAVGFDFGHIHSAKDNLSGIHPQALASSELAVIQFIKALDQNIT